MATPSEILRWVAGAALDRDPEADEIPTPAALAEWLHDCPEAAFVIATERLDAITAGEPGRRWVWTVNRPLPGIRSALESPEIIAHDGYYVASVPIIHARWLDIPDADRPLHPLTPIVAAWQARPVEVEPDITLHPHAGILPGPLAGAAVRVQVSDRTDPDRLPKIPGPLDAPDGDGWLPGFEAGPGPLARVPVLDFLHAGGLEAFKPGPGAPWPLRIAYEALIDVGRDARNGRIARLEYPLKGRGVKGRDKILRWMLWPEGEPKWSRDWPAFRRALDVVDRFSVPADGGMSEWLPIRVRSFPLPTGGVLRLDVSLPPGSERGPRILRRILRRLGARSYPQWRAWLALAYLWDRSAVGGHWVRATRPHLARDSAGRLLDATGAVILDKRGRPVTKWTDRRAVLLDASGRPVRTAGEAAREPNPEASRHPWLEAADIVALGYPPKRGLSPEASRKRKERMLKDLATFTTEGLAVLEAHPDERRWKVLPPGEDPE